MATRRPTTAQRWAPPNASAVRGYVKKPADPKAAAYFYTGPTLHFGHNPSKKGNKR